MEIQSSRCKAQTLIILIGMILFLSGCDLFTKEKEVIAVEV